MLIRAAKWASLRVDPGGFDSAASISTFAFAMAFKAIILALVLNMLLLPVYRALGLLPMNIDDAILVVVSSSWIVVGGVVGAVALCCGRALHALAVSRAEFARLSRTDMLSGLLNRRAFTDTLSVTKDDASLVIFDVDRFKSINDRFGHTAGDLVIRAVSQAISSIFEGCHSVARLGGEEFGVIIRGGSREWRLGAVERVRRTIAEMPICFDGRDMFVTISAGVADITASRHDEAAHFAADKALYLAKAAGRNRVVHESQGFETLELVADGCSDGAGPGGDLGNTIKAANG